MESTEKDQNFKQASTEAAKYLAVWALNALNLAPPNERLQQYALSESQKLKPREFPPLCHFGQLVAQAKDSWPSEAFDVMLKRFHGSDEKGKPVLARAG